MSREQDILFCKLAISSGLVKETDAQKVLSLCEKKERETGRRPLIGSLFEKYNLLGKPEVQKVYQAIQKRTGAAVGSERRASATAERGRPAGAARASRGPGARRRAASREDAPRAKVDQNALILGIGSIVVVIGVLVFVFVKLNDKPKGGPLGGTRTDAPAAAPPPAPDAGTAASPSPAASPKTPGAPPAAPRPATPPPAVKPPRELSREELNDLNSKIQDIRSTFADHPADGLARLEAERKRLTDTNVPVPENLLGAITEFETRKKDAEASGAGVDPPPELKPEEEAPDAAEPETPAEPEAPSEPETPAEPETDAEPDEAPADEPGGDDAPQEEPAGEAGEG